MESFTDTLNTIHSGLRFCYEARWPHIRAVMHRGNAGDIAEWCKGKAQKDNTVTFRQDGRKHTIRLGYILAQTGPEHFTIFKSPEEFARVYGEDRKGTARFERFADSEPKHPPTSSEQLTHYEGHHAVCGNGKCKNIHILSAADKVHQVIDPRRTAKTFIWSCPKCGVRNYLTPAKANRNHHP